jgi:hypothetical protein
MKLVLLSKAVSKGHTLEANHCPNIFQQLPNGIGGKLMELHVKLQQYICENYVWRHPQDPVLEGDMSQPS